MCRDSIGQDKIETGYVRETTERIGGYVIRDRAF
jgi:hypothetical protein